MILIRIIFAVFAIAIMNGCATTTVTNETLSEKAAIALSVPKGSVIVSEREDGPVSTTYLVRSGKNAYRCSITSGYSVLGHQTSEAICKKDGEPAQQTKCNALLRAAGKCI